MFTGGESSISSRREKAGSENRPERSEHAAGLLTSSGLFSLTFKELGGLDAAGVDGKVVTFLLFKKFIDFFRKFYGLICVFFIKSFPIIKNSIPKISQLI